MDSLDNFLKSQPPTALRPLLGQTVLVVEDSRFACEAVRLVCIRSGARIRRADGLASARRHLSAYRPSVMLVDIGLPDGSGLDLIAEAAVDASRVDVLLATSGDDVHAKPALAAGADDFLLKPIASVGAFQAAVLAHLPPEAQPRGPRAVSDDAIVPDTIAYQDDLAHAQDMLNAGELHYVAQFLSSLSCCVEDAELVDVAQKFAWAPENAELRARVEALLSERMGTRLAV